MAKVGSVLGRFGGVGGGGGGGGRGVRIFRNINFPSQHLLDLLFTCRLSSIT